MVRHGRATGTTTQQSLEQGAVLVAGHAVTAVTVGLEQSLDSVEGGLIDDCGLLPGDDLAFVHNFARVSDVDQDPL